MGGHGGLNILPQKKWNVYNWDNRIKVEKDKRLAREKQQKEDQEDHDDQARDRIRKLKQKQRSRSASPKQSGLNEELKIIQQQNKPINLFEKEEEIINQKENVKAQIELSKEFFKDKPFDLSSKFLGSFADDSKPWYAKPTQKPKSDVQEVIKEQINEFNNQNQTYYTILNVDKKQQKQKVEAKNATQRNDVKIEDNHDKEKEERKRLKKLQKLGLKLKEMLGSDAESSPERKRKEKEFNRQKLRKERLARERQEYFREKKLLDEMKFQ